MAIVVYQKPKATLIKISEVIDKTIQLFMIGIIGTLIYVSTILILANIY